LPATGSLPVAGDLDRNGHADLVVPVGASGLSVLLGNGAGGFALSNVPLSLGSNAACLADIDGDGVLDVASLDDGGTVGWLAGAGNGSFGALASLDVLDITNATAIAAGDFNGDGRPDLVAIGYIGGLGGLDS